MGNGPSQSRATSETNVTNIVVNKTDMDFFNQTINTSITEKSTKSASSCASSTGVKQEISLKDIIVGGNLVINGLDQTAELDVNFSCVNKVSLLSDIQSDMITKMMNQVDSITDTSLQSDIKNSLAASAESSGFQVGSGGTSSDVDSVTNINNNTTNETNVKVKNIVENTVKNVFNEEALSECLSRVNTNQIIGLKRIEVDGDLTLNDITQRAVVSILANCVSEQNFGTSIITSLAQQAGMTFETINTSSSDTKATTDLSASSKQTGILPDFGKFEKLIAPSIGSVAISSVCGVLGVVMMTML